MGRLCRSLGQGLKAEAFRPGRTAHQRPGRWAVQVRREEQADANGYDPTCRPAPEMCLEGRCRGAQAVWAIGRRPFCGLRVTAQGNVCASGLRRLCQTALSHLHQRPSGSQNAVSHSPVCLGSWTSRAAPPPEGKEIPTWTEIATSGRSIRISEVYPAGQHSPGFLESLSDQSLHVYN